MHGKSILIVEDEPMFAQFLKISLTEFGYKQLTEAATLHFAIEAIKAKQPHLILLDLNLPDSKGTETLKQLKASVDSVPIVIISGVDDPSVIIESARLGARDYVSKATISLDDLRKTIEEALIDGTRNAKFQAGSEKVKNSIAKLAALTL
jgi:DNA-binding NarL/FixJ family response regulator